MFNLLEPLQQKNIGFEDFAKFISEKIELKFENQETTDKKPFLVKSNQWWIQTKYLGQYDKNQNDELSWAECIDLLVDLYNTGVALDAQSEAFLRSELKKYFSSQIVQQVLGIKGNKRLQTTSILDVQAGRQSDFLIQIEQSNPLSLTSQASEFTGCENLSKVRFQGLQIKHDNNPSDAIEVLFGIKVIYTCSGESQSADLLMKLKLTDEVLQIIDWGLL